MKTLELNEMISLNGLGEIDSYLANNSDLNAWEACVVTSGLGGLVGGAIFGPGALVGWFGGLVVGAITC